MNDQLENRPIMIDEKERPVKGEHQEKEKRAAKRPQKEKAKKSYKEWLRDELLKQSIILSINKKNLYG